MKRVFFEEDNEPFLEYERGEVLEYQEKMRDFILPSSNDSLLHHIDGLLAFLDDIHELVRVKAENKLKECSNLHIDSKYAYIMDDDSDDDHSDDVLKKINIDVICQTLMEWHTDIRKRKEKMTDNYAICYLMSWGAFCRIFHLSIYCDKRKLAHHTDRCAKEYEHCQRVKTSYNVVITDDLVIEYSDSKVWNSMRIILESLYTYSYDASMREYVYALFYRYCDLICLVQIHPEKVFKDPLFVTFRDEDDEEDDGDECDADLIEEVMREDEEGKEGEDDYDDNDDELDDTLDAFRNHKIKVNREYTINNEFLDEGELLFFDQLSRLDLSSKLFDNKNSITIAYTKTRDRKSLIKDALEAWTAMCCMIGEDKILRTEIISRFKSQIVEMHLHHGEKKSFKRQFPESACEPQDIISNYRPHVMTKLNQSQHNTMRQIVTQYKKEFTTVYDEESTEVLHTENEIAALLLTKVCTTVWLGTGGKSAKIKRMCESFVLEELQSLGKIESIFCNVEKHKCPVFLKLMRVYYVIDVQNSKIFKSLVFIEAYMLWMALCLNLKMVTESKIHSKIVAIVKTLSTLIKM